ncbi:MAG: hypothetical protein FWC64_11495 [Treponema sp.]|nr:hypothetical protein [Treponema sp.]
MEAKITIKRLTLFLVLFPVGYNSYSESVFTYDFTRKQIILSTLSLGVFMGSNFIDIQRDTPHLDRNDVNFFDRGLMFPRNEALVNARTIILYGNAVLPIISPLAGSIRRLGFLHGAQML